MTERKRSGATRTATPAPEEPILPPTASPNASEALGSPRRGLTGWFGLLIRVCVYMTAAVCVELLLSAFNRWLVSEDE